jgi:hypothetical protein
VFFEVLMLEGIRKHVPREAMRTLEIAIGDRARRIMPWVLLVLYSAGIGLAWHHRAALAHPFDNTLGLLPDHQDSVGVERFCSLSDRDDLATHRTHEVHPFQAHSPKRVLSHGRDRDPGQDHVLSALVISLSIENTMSHVPVLRRLTVSLALGGLWSGAAWAEPSTSTLSPIVIKAPVGQSVLQADLRQEKARLDAVPGGTNLILPQHEVRLVTLRDALDYQPGLVVQDFFGGIDQPRLNIRGSGIQSNPVQSRCFVVARWPAFERGGWLVCDWFSGTA